MEEKDKVQGESKRKGNILINILIILFIFILSTFMYAKYIGTSSIRVKEYRLASKNIPQSFSGSKIIYFSDVLIGSSVRVEDMKEIIEKINLYKPDIVIFGGNLINEDVKLKNKDIDKIIEYLNNIEATLGKYSVKGDLDNKIYNKVIKKTDFIEIDNKFEMIYKEDNTPICLVGVGSYNAGSYDLSTSFSYTADCYSIMVTHEGDIIDKVIENEKKPNVILSGNSLGGEINIPFYGPLLKFEGSKNYYKDYEKRNNINIYVSSGIGTRKYGMRLFNRPSFNLFRLKSIH